MDIRIYIAIVLYDKLGRETYTTMVYSLRGSLFTWKYLILNWNEWSFSEKRTDRICYKLNKNNK